MAYIFAAGVSHQEPLVIQRLIRVIVVMVVAPQLLVAQSERLVAPSYAVQQATSRISIDGVLDEPAWEDATVIPLSWEWNPGDNVTPPVRTEGLLTFDENNVYVAFRAFDPDPSSIRANLMDRDSIATFVQDDHVLVMLDTFNDERRAFQFRVNPLGVQADAIFGQNEGIEDFSWDIIWHSAGRITADGYIVEMAIPLNQIRFPQTAGPQTWGIELGRSWPRSARHRISANPRNRDDACILCQVNKVTGFQGLQPGLNLEVVPTVTATRTDSARSFPDSGLTAGGEEVDPGITARWGITPAITMNAAINPDFSQVEADAAQLAENQRFALFFEEKRPFFLEGIDFFATPINAVFTRTVVDPRWGLKLTGKEGRNAGGVFVTDDAVNSLVIPANRGSAFAFLDQSVTAGVLRYRRDVGAAASVGLLFAGREGDGYHNRVGGIDGFFRLRPTDVLRVQYLHSDTRYPGAISSAFGQPAEAFGGDAFRVNYQHVSRNWLFFGNYDDRDPEFRADSGFVPRVDVRTLDGNLIRRFWGAPGSWYTAIQIGGSALRTEDHSGRLTDERQAITATVAGASQSLIQVTAERLSTFFVDRLYRDMFRMNYYVEMQPGRFGKVTFIAVSGDAVDFANNQAADQLLLMPAVELKLGRHVNAQLSHIFQRLDVDGGRLSEANVSQLRLVYNFNVRSFVRGVIQRQDIDRNPALFVNPTPPTVETLFTQLLFSYKVNPQTVFFLGYSDNHLGLQQIDLTRTDRTYFAKIGYAWIF
jgi:hypothetical protein